MFEAIQKAHEENQKQIELINKMVAEIGKPNTAPTGPFQGISEMARAAEVPIRAAISGEQS